nr:leucine-rich repeat extensin-like protein 3 [Ipomoea trifida]
MHPTTLDTLLFPFFFALCAAVAFADQSPEQQKTTGWWCVIMRCPVVPLVPLFPDIPPWNLSPNAPWFQPPLPPFGEPGTFPHFPGIMPPPPPPSHHHSRRHRHHHSRHHQHSEPLPRLSSATRHHRHPPLSSATRNHRHPRLRSATRNHRHPPSLPPLPSTTRNHRHSRLRSATRNHRHPPSLPPLPSATRTHRHQHPPLRSATRNRKHSSNPCRLRHPHSHPPPTETITIKPILPPSPSAAVEDSPLKPSSLPASPPPGNSEPLIPPPVSTNQPSDCSMALIKGGDACVEDLTQSASGNQILIKRDCCKIILQLSDECFHKAFTKFTDPNFRNKARAFCSP